MVDVWLDAVVLLQVGPSLCAGVVVSDDLPTEAPADVPTEATVTAPTIVPPAMPEVRERIVATAYHCVASGLRPLVQYRDGTSYVGRVIARDPAHDLALVVADGPVEGLPLRADAPVVGETVYALGHPFGQASGGKLANLLVWSASRGMVSGVGPWLVQTDTALNPGNSGGPLVDEQGRIVGVVSRKIQAEGLGFASKSDRVEAMIAEPDMGPFIGGSWGVGAGFFQGDRAEVGANVTFVFRERVVARGWLGAGLGDLQPFGLVTLEARQRVGRGPLSTTLDLGVGGRWFDDTVTPLVTGRVAIAAVGFGAHVVPGPLYGQPWAWTFTLDIEWPGKIGVF